MPYRPMFPTGYAKGFGPGFGPYGPNGPDGPESGPTGLDKTNKNWKPDPRKMAAGWTQEDYHPDSWPDVEKAIRKQKILDDYRQQVLEHTKDAEENFPSQLSAERLSQQDDSQPRTPPSSIAEGPSTSPKPKLILKASPPKLTIKINPRAAGNVGFTAIPMAAANASSAVISKPAANSKLWSCGDLKCTNDDMTSKPREEFGRKFISDFFGRNKSETVIIHDDVWNWFCRKDYQRSKYASEKSTDAYMAFWLPALHTQLIRLRLWRPEATFDVKLLSRAEQRLNAYNSELLKNGGNAAAAQQAVLVVPTLGKKGPIQPSNADAIDPVQAQHIKSTFAGVRSIDYILDTIYPWIEQSLQSGALSRMPPIEFLINDAVPGDTVNSPTENYQMWLDTLPVAPPSPITPRWTAEDHQAALALMALSGSQSSVPMNLTAEAHKAAVDPEAVIAAAATVAAAAVQPAHVASTGPRQRYNGVPFTGNGKARMIEEDQEVAVPEMTHNTRGKKRKAAPAPAEQTQRKRTRSSGALLD